MFKLFLIFLVAIGFGLSQPRSREVIVNALTPLGRPVYGFITNQQLKRLVADLEASENDTGVLPFGRNGDFQTWIRREYESERRRTDAWGNRFELVVGISNFTVVSPGSDGVFDTDDDLTASGIRGVTPP